MVLNDDIITISIRVYFASIVRNYKNKVYNLIDIKDDLIQEGCCAILENRKQFENLLEKDRFNMQYKLARNAMYNYIYQNITKHTPLCGFEDFDIMEGDLLDFICCEDCYNLDFKFLINSFKFCLKDYEKKDVEILLKYFFFEDGKTTIIKKFNLKKDYLSCLVRGFRIKYFLYLKSFGYDFSFDFKNDEFSLSVSQKRKKIKDEAKKNNVEIFFDDKVIYKLMRENPQNDYAKILNKSFDYVSKIINRKSWVFKLKTFEVQLLRKKFFPECSIEKLLEGV